MAEGSDGSFAGGRRVLREQVRDGSVGGALRSQLDDDSLCRNQSWNFCGRIGVSSATAWRTAAGSNEVAGRIGLDVNREMNQRQDGHLEAMMRQLVASPSSRTDCVRDEIAVVDNPRLWTDCGHSASAAAACSWTIEATACARTWIVRGHDCWRGLNADTANSWTWIVCVGVLFSTESRPWICPVRGHEPHASRGQSSLTPRLIRGRRILVPTRGKACPVLT